MPGRPPVRAKSNREKLKVMTQTSGICPTCLNPPDHPLHHELCEVGVTAK